MLAGNRWLTEIEVQQFQVGYLMCRACMNNLADSAIQRSEVLYHCRPKLHQLGHLTFHFLPRNPRYYMNYCGEDFVARTKRVAEVCHPAHTSHLTLLRYVIHVCLKFSGSMV